MKKFIIFLLLSLVIFQVSYSQADIAAARAMAVGATVTVTGVVTNGSELGVIRYIQDATAGIGVYSSTLSSVQRGDNITVTGTLSSYNQLLEISPVTSFTVNSTGNTLPQPVLVTPSQATEAYEGMLIRIDNILFGNAGSSFAGNTNYNFTSGGESGVARINTSSNLVGTIIPANQVSLIAICSQYSYSSPTTGYQMLPRDIDDLVSSVAINFITPLQMSNLSQSGFTLNWTTDIAGTTEVYYGLTTNLELGTLSSPGTGTNHTINLTGFNPSDVVYVNAFSVYLGDTAFSSIKVFITQSESSGDIKVYFTQAVDHAYSNGVDAIQIFEAADDTVINYINRATQSIDLAIYNFSTDGISNIATALNNAYSNGIQIRIIYDGGTTNSGIDALNAGIPVLPSPTSSDYGIMHNKFIIFDAHSSDPNLPILWTGSCNFTSSNINEDANNLIIFQDKSLALGYELEFNEMWGSNTTTPNATLSKFGPYKVDNTPHEYIVGGNRVENYFSPSDNVNSHIISTINSANTDLSIGTMLITRSDLAYAIEDASQASVATNVICNSEGECTTTVVDILNAELGVHFTFDDVTSGILHNKYMIVDQFNASSDPIVWTGSHNWSNSADQKNDENTVVVHNATIANLYYQEFASRFVANNGSFGEITTAPTANIDVAQTQQNQPVTISVLENDVYQAALDLTLENDAANGSANVNFSSPTITYHPNTDFYGSDSIKYRIAYTANTSLFAIGTVYITVTPLGISTVTSDQVQIYPNPTSGKLWISLNNNIQLPADVEILDFTGRIVSNNTLTSKTSSFDLSNLNKGVYFLRINHNSNCIKPLVKE